MPRVGVRAARSLGSSEGVRDCERDNGDANFDLWAIVSDYGSHRT